jgi:hypothetical protein
MDNRNGNSRGDSYEVDLSRFDNDFSEAQVETKEFDSIPDGKYQVNVEKVEITTTKTTGNPMLKWTLKILAPNFRGRLLWRNNVMATGENIRWLKNDLHTCGLELQKLSDLPANLPRLLDVKLEVTTKTKGENQNVYFNRRIILDDAADAGSSGIHSSGDVPF